VEQIRERDLMMPQEVRQMPESKMILLVEGQRPIFADKLRFFNMQPFKQAEAYAQAHIPSVPEIEYLPSAAVPATTPEYERAGRITEKEAHEPGPNQPEVQSAVEPSTASVAKPNSEAGVRRVVNSAAIARVGAAVSSRATEDRGRLKELEDNHSAAAARLKEIVEKTATGKSPAKRKSVMDVFLATVPDPEPAQTPKDA
jgi:type IV secretion system protein VirD4